MIDLSAPVDRAFTQALPKIEVGIKHTYYQFSPKPPQANNLPPNVQVHAHLSGSISRQCLHEIWKRKKQKDPNFPVEDPLVLMPPGKVDYTLQTYKRPVSTLFFQVFSKLIYQLCDDLESLTYATKCVLESFLNDGVRYLELRTIPRASPTSNITRETYLTTILDTIAQFPSKDRMSVYLILALDRGNTSATEALEIIDLAIASKARGVVGVDLCGNPTQGDVAIYRDAFARAKAHGLGVTLHFAETPASGNPRELETLLSFRPDRLGHVIHVPGETKREIARRRLGLELCMSCNVHAKLIEGGFLDHHFGEWRRQDCPIALCTDDVGFFCSPVSNEYLLAAEHFGVDRAEMLSMCEKSVEMIFGGEEEKQRLREIISQFKE
ncbi:Adenosine deaminase-like protein [Penicillium rolfsii]|nr:Adenosine deaminase-like protein [Penicillium rolfsii]